MHTIYSPRQALTIPFHSLSPHPNFTSDAKVHEQYARITEAYTVLKDPSRRKQYNETLDRHVSAPCPRPLSRFNMQLVKRFRCQSHCKACCVVRTLSAWTTCSAETRTRGTDPTAQLTAHAHPLLRRRSLMCTGSLSVCLFAHTVLGGPHTARVLARALAHTSADLAYPARNVVPPSHVIFPHACMVRSGRGWASASSSGAGGGSAAAYNSARSFDEDRYAKRLGRAARRLHPPMFVGGMQPRCCVCVCAAHGFLFPWSLHAAHSLTAGFLCTGATTAVLCCSLTPILCPSLTILTPNQVWAHERL